VRNLNGQEIGGRPLRIDLAETDPFLEGKTTIRGELIDAGETRAQWRERERERERDFGGGRSGGGKHASGAKNDVNAFLAKLPRGVQIPPGSSSLDAISTVLARESPAQIIEVLAQMKAFVITHPDYARSLLVAHPQLGYALFQALLLNKIVDPTVLNRMLAATASSNPQTSAPPHAPAQPHYPPQPVHHPQPGYGAHPVPPPHLANQPLGGTPPNSMYPPPQNPHMPPPAQLPPYYGRPPPPPPVAPQQSMPPPQPQGPPQIPNPMGYDAAQRDMLAQVLALTQEQINSLPPMERDQIIQLRKSLGVSN